MAVRYLNAKGGVLGRRVKLIVEDDATDPKQAISVAKKLASQGVKFVAGHLNSGASIQASAVYAEHGILQITPYSPNPALTENAHKKGWRNVFRVYTRDETHGIAVGRFLAENFKTKKIAILHDRTAFGNGLAYKAREILRKAGVVEAVYQAYTPRQREYSALMSQLGSAGISVIYIGAWYWADVGLMIRQAHERGYRPQVISTDTIITPQFWGITGSTGEGTLMTYVPDPRKNPEAKGGASLVWH